MEHVGRVLTERARTIEKGKVLKLAWCAELSTWFNPFTTMTLHTTSAARHYSPRAWSQKEQMLSSIYYLSCQIQDLPRICKPIHQPTQRRVTQTLRVMLLYVYPGKYSLLCYVRVATPKSWEGRREWSYTTTKRWNAIPQISYFIEKSRASGENYDPNT